MNIIMILVDSVNRRFLSPYSGDQYADTPNLSRFARRSWRFDNHFVGSLPCIPARRELFAGFQEMLWRPWGPLEPFDARFPHLIADRGYSTGLVTDHYHYWEDPGHGYLQSFQSTELIRGHELDNWHLPWPPDAAAPEWVRSIERWRPTDFARRYYANVREFEDETDFFAAKVMRGGADWLRTNKHRTPYFLQVETFDVHEPFHLPEPYRSRYWNGSDPEKFTMWPPYQSTAEQENFVEGTNPEEIAYIRSQYHGKIAMMDHWFGTLLDAFDEQDIWSDTVVIFTTDHGHDLCERGEFGKQYPHFDSHAHIPLLMWHPDHPEGGAVSSLTSTVDLFTTVLDLAGVDPPEHTHGRSLVPLLSGDTRNAREGVLYGSFGQGLCVTDGEWSLFKSPVDSGPLFYYSSGIFESLNLPSRNVPEDQGNFIPDIDLPQWKVPVGIEPRNWENHLFDKTRDPEQLHNVWDAAPKDRARLLDLMRTLIDEQGAPPEQYQRLGLDRV